MPDLPNIPLDNILVIGIVIIIFIARLVNFLTSLFKGGDKDEEAKAKRKKKVEEYFAADFFEAEQKTSQTQEPSTPQVVETARKAPPSSKRLKPPETALTRRRERYEKQLAKIKRAKDRRDNVRVAKPYQEVHSKAYDGAYGEEVIEKVTYDNASVEQESADVKSWENYPDTSGIGEDKNFGKNKFERQKAEVEAAKARRDKILANTKSLSNKSGIERIVSVSEKFEQSSKRKRGASTKEMLSTQFDRHGALKTAIIFAEIFGKPKSLK